LAVTDLFADRPQEGEFLASADGTFQVWLNGREVFQRKNAAVYQPNSERFDTTLAKGLNRLLVQVVSNQEDARFQLRFRRKSSKAEHERLTRFVLEGRGSAERGRELFLNSEKSQCIKCHRLGELGGRIGPDLAGIGSRFSRIHLVESILEPSRTVAPSYETRVVVLASGRVMTGVKVTETATLLTLGDNQGKTHDISKSEIDETSVQSLSTMPDSLEKRLTEREFIDLIDFLLSQKKVPPK
jgi:putative heme-binding domain-containing protein